MIHLFVTLSINCIDNFLFPNLTVSVLRISVVENWQLKIQKRGDICQCMANSLYYTGETKANKTKQVYSNRS